MYQELLLYAIVDLGFEVGDGFRGGVAVRSVRVKGGEDLRRWDFHLGEGEPKVKQVSALLPLV
jgi:hypothetical protein